MAYFNYHAKAKRLIETGHCVKAEVVEAYKTIAPALVLYFDNNVPMPIRWYKFDDYLPLLKRCGVTVAYVDG